MLVDTDGRDGGDARNAAVEAAAGALRRGLVVALPTDTVYGIGALPDVPGATDRLFELKGRSAAVPIAVLCADAAQALALTDPAELGEDVQRIADRLWPGPLTLVLRRRPGLGYSLGEPAGTVGVRCPDHDLVRALAAEVGPIAVTSANRHGEPTPPTAPEVAALFGDGVALVLDGGRCAAPPSTVVDASGPAWRLLREGEIPLSTVETAAKPE
jgi:tRNA threonylcarbamoyl adenosine modification protein (Sua5/YciO/YrdC/YwlC family)